MKYPLTLNSSHQLFVSNSFLSIIIFCVMCHEKTVLCTVLWCPIYKTGQSSNVYCYLNNFSSFCCLYLTVRNKLYSLTKILCHHISYITLWLDTKKFVHCSFFYIDFLCCYMKYVKKNSTNSCVIVCSRLMHLLPKTLFPASHYIVWHVIITYLCFIFSHIRLEPNLVIIVSGNWHMYINHAVVHCYSWA